MRIEALRKAVRALIDANRRLRERLRHQDESLRALRGEVERLGVELAEERTDPLSGLPGRREFTRRTAALLRACTLVGGGSRYAVTLVDLDGFKAVNDTFGHAAGDAVLAAVGERITRWLGEGEVAARPGGDEFFVLAVCGASLPHRLRALHEAITAPVAHQGVALVVGASLGTAEVRGVDDLSRAIGLADKAMFQVKGRGRRGCTAPADTPTA
ncbi:GGDEF domain-containing protein [Kitasatospora mediocidica]|uniref:GGDEF domain-containing protein n=1 Tax=Kitasatospora mediocidica TaxID=58352 RepID=UPI0018DE8713|nr:GGDEF domain-containing protein [Kitasatospora mediocidica]